MKKRLLKFLSNLLIVVLIISSQSFTGTINVFAEGEDDTKTEETVGKITVSFSGNGSGSVSLDFYEDAEGKTSTSSGGHTSVTTGQDVAIPSSAVSVKITLQADANCEATSVSGIVNTVTDAIKSSGELISIDKSANYNLDVGFNQTETDTEKDTSNQNGKIRFFCQTNVLIGGNIEYSFDGTTYSTLSENGSAYGVIELDAGKTEVYLKFVANSDYELDTTRGVHIRKNGIEDSKNTSVTEAVYKYNLPSEPLTQQYEVEFGWGSKKNEEGEKDDTTEEGNQNGIIRFYCQRYSVTGGHIKFSFDGNDYTQLSENGSAYGVITIPTSETPSKVYFEFEPSSEYSLDSGRGVAIRVNGAETPTPLSANGGKYEYTLPTDPLSQQYEVEFGWESKSGSTPGEDDAGDAFSGRVDICSSNQNTGRVAAVKVNTGSEWVDFNSDNFSSLLENSKFKLRITMNEGFTIDDVSVRFLSSDNKQVVNYQFGNGESLDTIINGILSNDGYEFTFKPATDSKSAGGESSLNSENSYIRIEYRTAVVYSGNVGVSMFFQTKNGNDYGVEIEDEFIDGVGDNEISFSFNENNYGGQGTPSSLGYGVTNTGDGAISVTYTSQYGANKGKSQTFTPQRYDKFTAGGYSAGGNNNVIRIPDYDGLIDEVYISTNTVFTNDDKVTPVTAEDGDRTINVYTKTLTAQANYYVLIRNHKSSRVSLKWSYSQSDSATDFYVDNGKIFLEKVVRDNVTIFDTESNQGELVFENNLPKTITNQLERDYDVTASAGEVFINVGDVVTVRLIPTYGYQIKSADLNGATLTPGEARSSFTFTVNGNLHLAGAFIQESNQINLDDTEAVVSGVIANGGNATDTGSLGLTVVDKDPATYEKASEADEKAKEKNSKADLFATIDMGLESMVSKGNGYYWKDTISEFDDPITASLGLAGAGSTSGSEFIVVREHNGNLEVLENVSFSNGKLNIPTNKFSTYSIYKVAKSQSSGGGSSSSGSSSSGSYSGNSGSSSSSGNSEVTKPEEEEKGPDKEEEVKDPDKTEETTPPAENNQDKEEEAKDPDKTEETTPPSENKQDKEEEVKPSEDNNSNNKEEVKPSEDNSTSNNEEVKTSEEEKPVEKAETVKASEEKKVEKTDEKKEEKIEEIKPSEDKKTDKEETVKPADNKKDSSEISSSNKSGEKTKPDVIVETKLNGSSKESWKALAETITESMSDDNGKAIKAEVKVEMGTTTEVPVELFEDIKGKDVDVVFEMDNGISWTVNGQDIGNVDFASINLEVKLDKGDIPENKIEEISGGKEVVNLSLSHDGEFGFEATLSVDMGAQNAGMYANLYYVNPKTGEYEFVASSPIDENGNANLGFGHASDYTIVIDSVGVTESKEVAATVSTSAPSNGLVWAILLIVAGLIVLLGIVLFILRAKFNKE